MVARSNDLGARVLTVVLATALLVAIPSCGGTDGRGLIIDETGGSAGDDDAASAPGGGGQGGQDMTTEAGRDSSRDRGGSAGASSGDDDGGIDAGAPEAGTEAEASTSVCGNHIVEPGEECDDGNTLDGDGCSSICMDSRCCEDCQANNCPIDNHRNPMTGDLDHQPSCDAFLDAQVAKEGNAAGTPKKQLCYAVMGCIERTRCASADYPAAAGSAGGVTSCYCGSASLADCKKDNGPKGPCKNEIEDGLESSDPATVLTRLVKVGYGGGAALNRALCSRDYCSTVNGAHSECYRPQGTMDPYPACDMFGVDAGSMGGASGMGGAGGSSDTGGSSGTGGTDDSGPDVFDSGSDARPDTSVGGFDAATDATAIDVSQGTDAQSPSEAAVEASVDAASADVCSIGKEPPLGTTCTDCEALNCPHDATGCSSGSCAPDSHPSCSDYLAAADQALCQTTLDCARRTNCGANGVSTCYCGTQSIANCRGGMGDGVCKSEVEAGLKSTDPAFIVDSLTKTLLPGGGAMKIVLCDHDFCGFLNGANNECMPYCK
jgi:cysteine-rich repeat protein